LTSASGGTSLRIIERVMPKHGQQHREPMVSDPTQGAPMRVAFSAHRRILNFAFGIVDDADSGPMIEGVTESFVAALAHKNDFLFTALPCDRCSPRVTTQTVIISFRDGL